MVHAVHEIELGILFFGRKALIKPYFFVSIQTMYAQMHRHASQFYVLGVCMRAARHIQCILYTFSCCVYLFYGEARYAFFLLLNENGRQKCNKVQEDKQN